METGLHHVPLRGSLLKPRLLAGAERELFLFLVLVCTAMVFVTMSWPAAFAGIVLWGLGTWALREMAKVDPMMSKVYTRHRRYQSFYPARSSYAVKQAKKGKVKKCWR